MGRPPRARGDDEALVRFGRRIELARVNAGIRSAAEIARRVGVSEASMSAYIRGRQKPTDAVLDRIADVLGVAPADLLRDDAPGKAPAASLEDRCRRLGIARPPAKPPQATHLDIDEIVELVATRLAERLLRA